ncbi:hypothetical protein AAG570_002032 [Ranatra chinensis]|uniref:Transport and Golgi organization protein 6 homolog n=1 Tax=Ranatra chinensis TaxID=642074 RepID=A0ABD0YAJ0_9HEMI
MADGGVVATVKAILDVVGLASDSPRHAHNVSVLARLIVTPHTKDPEGYYRQICPEVISLLTSPEPHFVQVSVMCLRSLHGSKPDLFSRYFLDPMVRPLREPSGEGEVSTCVDRLYNCFAIPSSEMWSLPKRKLVPLAGPLFQLHFKVCRSVCKLKSKAEDLAWNCLREAEGAELEAVLEAAILTGGGIGFEFGGEGGVVSVTTANPPEFEEASDNLLDLVAVHDSEGRVKARLFNKSLQCLADCSTGLSWRLLAAKLLSVLSIEPQVYDAVNRDPKDLIAFLKTLLIESSDPEIISIGLMVLGAVLGDTTAAPGRDWTLFSTLAAPLRTLKDLPGMDNLQLKMLAEETYCLILTHGVVTKDVVDAKEVTGGGVCDQAIKEACDPLLPVRAHALRVLAKLVLTGDLTAKIKKQTILCLFKENLKDSDSYLYLSAVEGLASMGSVFPEEVLLALLEQYVACKETELRLKVGEVLIRVTRNMGELVYNYKAELLNAMLHGCRDPEPLVRSSSLSNLGELCKILAFHIGVFTIEIFDCVQSIFLNDKAPEARRAAIMVLTLLLKGLGTSALSVLEPVLLEMYRGLKKAYVLEKDDVARLQAQLALEEISALTKQYLMPEQSFNKRIYVLDPPHS